MTVMVLLRIFADLGFYYAFAATVSSALGGRFHFPALLLLAACYAACCRFREQKRRQRLRQRSKTSYQMSGKSYLS